MSLRLRGALLLSGLVLGGCPDGRSPTQRAMSSASPIEGSVPASPETRRKAPVTLEIIAASKRLLEERAGAPIGSEFPLDVAGKRYLARIEEHDNEEGSPERPAGKHKGVTVYEP
jgi:hypothetical protein